jgi:hypothetical protein
MAEMLLKVTLNTKQPTQLYFFMHLLLPVTFEQLGQGQVLQT